MLRSFTVLFGIAATLALTPGAVRADGVHFRVGLGLGHRAHVEFGLSKHHGYRRYHVPHFQGRFYPSHRHHVHRHIHHVHRRVPIYVQVWVPPVYETVVVGCDVFGRPIYRRVLVSAGYYRKVIRGYSCAICGATL